MGVNLRRVILLTNVYKESGWRHVQDCIVWDVILNIKNLLMTVPSNNMRRQRMNIRRTGAGFFVQVSIILASIGKQTWSYEWMVVRFTVASKDLEHPCALEGGEQTDTHPSTPFLGLC